MEGNEKVAEFKLELTKKEVVTVKILFMVLSIVTAFVAGTYAYLFM